jgi:hypothetical protein
MVGENEIHNDVEGKALRDLERAEGDLKHAEEGVHEALTEPESTRKEHCHLITIHVDGDDHQVRPGKWIVCDLKSQLSIDQAKVLAEITPQGLRDLDDNSEIELHEKEQFMTHARSGGSS